MNQTDKKRLRWLFLALLVLSIISIVFVSWNYREILQQNERAAFERIEAIGSFLSTQVDTADYRLLAAAVGKEGSGQKLTPREASAAARLRTAFKKMELSLPAHVSLRLATKNNLSTYDDRFFVDLIAATTGDGSNANFTVPSLLWDSYAGVDITRSQRVEGNDTLSIYAPVMDASHRVVGHIWVAQDFHSDVVAARQHLMYSSGLFLLALLVMLLVVGYFAIQLMRYHVQERFSDEEQRNKAAELDTLTGLYNRSYVMDQIAVQLKQARASNGAFAVMLLDMDHFKTINDLHGPHVGDDLIRLVGGRVRNTLPKSDLVGRAGGDEFVVLLRDVKNKQFASAAAERIVQLVNNPFLIKDSKKPDNEQQIKASVSIGLCFYPDDGNDVGTLMRSAATALSHAKMSGRNGFQLFDSQMSRIAVERLRIEKDLERALDDNQLELWYQPKFSLDKVLVGMEALLRWKITDDEIIPPTRFIPVAESTGQIIKIGHWVIEEAARQLSEWNRQGYRSLRMSVNVSPAQFSDDSLVPRIQKALEENNIRPSDFEVEITETTVMEKLELATKELYALSNIGVKIAIDDFGTGYSSLSKLAEFPIDVLKVDKSFIDDVPGSESSTMTTNTIILLARNLNKSVVAEGVENEEQLQYLRENGCDVIQGFLFGKPMTAENFADQFLKHLPKEIDAPN